MFSQDLCVLRPLELIEQLSAQHDIEILPDPCYHLAYRVLSVLGVNTQTGQPSQLLELLSVQRMQRGNKAKNTTMLRYADKSLFWYNCFQLLQSVQINQIV